MTVMKIACVNFPVSKVIILNCLLYPTNSPKLKEVQFKII